MWAKKRKARKEEHTYEGLCTNNVEFIRQLRKCNEQLVLFLYLHFFLNNFFHNFPSSLFVFIVGLRATHLFSSVYTIPSPSPTIEILLLFSIVDVLSALRKTLIFQAYLPFTPFPLLFFNASKNVHYCMYIFWHYKSEKKRRNEIFVSINDDRGKEGLIFVEITSQFPFHFLSLTLFFSLHGNTEHIFESRGGEGTKIKPTKKLYE